MVTTRKPEEIAKDMAANAVDIIAAKQRAIDAEQNESYARSEHCSARNSLSTLTKHADHLRKEFDAAIGATP